MSAEYMRNLMENIQKTHRLDENYDQRIQDVVNVINRDYPNGITKKEFNTAVEQAGKETGAVEMKPKTAGLNQRGLGDSRKDFIKDVAAKIKFKRDTSKTDAKRERTNNALNQLAHIISDAVGMSFPDGDPWDHIYPKARKLGVPAHDMLAWLDRAVKKAGMGNSYHGYLSSLWDDQHAAAKFDYDQTQANPKSKYKKSASDRYNSLGGDNYQNPWG